MSKQPPPQSIHDLIDTDQEVKEEEEVQDILHGLLEPTTDIINAVAQCNSKFGGIRINLGGLNLAFIPFEVKSLTDLRILNLRSNNLTMFPSEFCTVLNSLEELNLSQNAITYLPENLSALSNLRKLDVSWNKVAELPIGVFDLNALQELRLQGNLLQKLPGQVGDLHALHTLVLKGNYIKEIPLRCAELKFLTKVDLTDCPIENCPPGVMLLHQKNQLLLQKSKRKGLISRAHILKKTMDEQLSTILKEEAKEIEADKKGEGSN